MRWTRRGRISTTGWGWAVLALAGCGGDAGTAPQDPSDPTPPSVASVTVSLSESSIETGASTTATAVVRDAQGNELQRSVSWSTDAAGVATVNGSGVLRGVVPGTVVVTASSGGVSGMAQLEVRTRNIDDLVEAVRQEHGLPAMAGALVTRDGIVAVGVAGTRRAGGDEVVTIEDVWHIGSNLKAITAALAAVAVDRGALDWTTTVEAAFPELGAGVRDEYRDVTLLDLLSMAGGIRNDPPGAAYAGSTAREQREGVVAWALGADPIGDVGDYYYSNPGFIIAGAMIERALGGMYEPLVSSEIADPLDVGGIGWGPTTTAGGMDQPVGHTLQGGAWVPCEACDNPPGLSSAGRAHMPLGTWARIIQEFLRVGAGASAWVGASDGAELFADHTPYPSTSNSYGLGWIMTERSWGGRTATHTGSNVSNHSAAWLGLDTGVAMIAVTNAADLTTGTSAQGLDALVVRLLDLHQGGG